MTERQELYCHACARYVQFNIDTELDGQHTIRCPNCGHEHYRYVNRGRISDQRWGSSNQGPTGSVFFVTGLTTTAASTVGTALTNMGMASGTAATTFQTFSTAYTSTFAAQAWLQTTTAS